MRNKEVGGSDASYWAPMSDEKSLAGLLSSLIGEGSASQTGFARTAYLLEETLSSLSLPFTLPTEIAHHQSESGREGGLPPRLQLAFSAITARAA